MAFERLIMDVRNLKTPFSEREFSMLATQRKSRLIVKGYEFFQKLERLK